MSYSNHFTTEVMHQLPIPMGTLTSWLGLLVAIFAPILLISLLCFWRGRNAYVIGQPPADPISANCYGASPNVYNQGFGGMGLTGYGMGPDRKSVV